MGIDPKVLIRAFEVTVAGIGFPSGTGCAGLDVAVRDRRRYPRAQAMRTRWRWFSGLRNP
jgi:hypothetical protein